MNLEAPGWFDIIALVIFGAIVYLLVRPTSNAAQGVTAVSDALANVVKMAVGGS